MATVFLSYRRSDSQDVTGRIYDRLVESYSSKHVFKDVDSIPLGVSFPLHIRNQLQKADVVLVIIGRTWTYCIDEYGRRRLDDPNDFVRLEVEQALRARMPVVPVLVSNARMPLAAELPPSLQKLASRNGILVRPDPDFNNDVARLLAGLERLDGSRRGQGRAQDSAILPPGRQSAPRSSDSVRVLRRRPRPQRMSLGKIVLAIVGAYILLAMGAQAWQLLTYDKQFRGDRNKVLKVPTLKAVEQNDKGQVSEKDISVEWKLADAEEKGKKGGSTHTLAMTNLGPDLVDVTGEAIFHESDGFKFSLPVGWDTWKTGEPQDFGVAIHNYRKVEFKGKALRNAEAAQIDLTWEWTWENNLPTRTSSQMK